MLNDFVPVAHKAIEPLNDNGQIMRGHHHRVSCVSSNDIFSIHFYTLLFGMPYERVMSINILDKKQESLEKSHRVLDQIYSLVDKAYYVDSISYKIDNTPECPDNAE